MFKSIFRVAMCMAVSLSGFAQGQTPQAINYQASVRDNAGALLSNQELDVQFEIIQGADAVSGTVVYSELHSDITTNAFGIFSLEIGNGAPQSGTMAGVSWSADKSFLRVKIDDDNDGNFDELTAQQLVSVPYSLSAENALKINGYPVGSAMPVVDQVLKWDGSAWVPNTDETGGGTGDITSVTVVSGGGLTGGGLSGDVVLDADNTNAMWNADQIQGTAVDATLAPNSGEVLKWDGTNWTAAQDDVGAAGITAVNATYPLSSAVTSGNVDLTVANGNAEWNANQLQGRDISGVLPLDGQVLKWNDASNIWIPSTDNVGAVSSSPWTVTGNNITYNVPGGLVGIGSPSPAYKLDVVGQVRFSDILHTRGDIRLSHPTIGGGWIKGFTYLDGAGAFDAGFGLLGVGATPTKLYMGHGLEPWSSGDGIYITSAGKVGIGTASPKKEFHVDADTIRFTSFFNPTANNQMLVIEPDGDVITQDIPSGGASGISAVNASSPLVSTENSGVVNLSVPNGSALWNANMLQGTGVSNANPNTGQVLKFTGAVWEPADETGGSGSGIGQVIAGTGLTGGGSTPTVTLNAQTSSALWNANQLQSRNVSNDQPNAGQVLKWNGTSWAPGTDNVSSGGGDDLGDHIADQNIQLGTYYLSGDGDDEGVLIKADGNIELTDTLIIRRPITCATNPGNTRVDLQALAIDMYAGGTKILEGNSNNLKIDATNSVAIKGTAVKITNNGIGLLGQSATSTFSINTPGVIKCSGIDQSSDMRFKKGQFKVDNSLNRIAELNGYYYHWRVEEFPDRQFSDEREIGFMAQELEELFPELVTTDEEGYKSVNYSKITPVLVEAIKELKTLVETQQEALGRADVERANAAKERAELENKLNKVLDQLSIEANNK